MVRDPSLAGLVGPLPLRRLLRRRGPLAGAHFAAPGRPHHGPHPAHRPARIVRPGRRRPPLRDRPGRRAGAPAAWPAPRPAPWPPAGGRHLRPPTYVTSPPGDARRLFVVEQAGRMRLIDDGAALPHPVPGHLALVLDGGERGLLSMAFAPDYATSGRFYVYFTDRAGTSGSRSSGARPTRPGGPDHPPPVLWIEHSSQTQPQRRPAPVRPRRLPLRGHRATAAAGTTSTTTPRTSARCWASCCGSTPTWWPAAACPRRQRDIRPPGCAPRFPARQRVLRLGGVVVYARCGERCTVAASARVRRGPQDIRAGQGAPHGPGGPPGAGPGEAHRAGPAARCAPPCGGAGIPRCFWESARGTRSGNRSKLVRRRVAVRR